MSSQKLSAVSSGSWGSGSGLLFLQFVLLLSPPDRPQAIFGECPEEQAGLPLLVQALVTLSAVVRLQPPLTLLPLLFLGLSSSPVSLLLQAFPPFLPLPKSPLTKLPTMVANSDPHLLVYIPLHQAGLVCVTVRILWEWHRVTCQVKVTKDTWLLTVIRLGSLEPAATL